MSQAAAARRPGRAAAPAATHDTWTTLAAWSVAAFVVVSLLATRAAQQTGDSLLYAFAAKSGQDLFHPHHLLFTPMVRLIYLALAPVCAGCDAVLAGQIHNVAWAGATVAVFYLLVNKLTGHWPLSLGAAVLLLVTRGFWELATQTTVYVPAVGTLALLAGALLLRPAGPLPRRWVLLTAGLLALAVLYHQANLLFCLPLAYWLVARGGRLGWRLALAVVGLAGVIVLAVYIVAFLLTGAAWSLGGFVSFCLSYTTQVCAGGQCDASPSQWGAVTNLGTGFGTALHSLVWNYAFMPTRLVAVVATLFGLGVLALVLWHGWHTARGGEWPTLRLFLLLWLLSYGLFFWWWLPDYEHPFLLTVVPTLLLVYLAGRDLRAQRLAPRPAQLALVVANTGVVLALTGVNFAGTIQPLLASRGDSYVEAEALTRAVPSNCTILASYRMWNHLRYYFDRAGGTQQAKYPLSYFYQRRPLPAAYALDSSGCVVIDALFVSPDYVLNGYTTVPADGFGQRAEWLAYMAWLFGFEYDASQQVMAARGFEVIRLEEGGPYLKLLGEARPVSGLDDLFQQLDAALSATPGTEPALFSAWLSARP